MNTLVSKENLELYHSLIDKTYLKTTDNLIVSGGGE